MISWYVTIKMMEWLIWFGVGFYYLKIFFTSDRASWVHPLLASAFFIFGLADFVEYFTRGHFPWWLWIWKIAGGLTLFGLLIIDDYYRRGTAALSPWRFVAALIILAMAVECWWLSSRA
jgi:hypothetical protein